MCIRDSSMTFLSSVTIFSMRVPSLLQMPMTLFSSSIAFMMFAPSQAATVAPKEHHDVARAARNDLMSHSTNILTRSTMQLATWTQPCLLYTSDAADDLTRVDLG